MYLGTSWEISNMEVPCTAWAQMDSKKKINVCDRGIKETFTGVQSR